jgi:hypothetical protein
MQEAVGSVACLPAMPRRARALSARLPTDTADKRATTHSSDCRPENKSHRCTHAGTIHHAAFIPDSGCTLLDFSERTDQSVPSASIRMRLAPASVTPLVAVASKDALVASRSTHAEDLAEPIADTERELALLTTHRDRLAEFMKSKDLKVEQLLLVSRELSSAQTQIDSLNSQRANLQRRVATQVLTINLSLPDHPLAGTSGNTGLTGTGLPSPIAVTA